MSNIPFTSTANSITLFVAGVPVTVQGPSVTYDRLREALMAKDFDAVPGLLAPFGALREYLKPWKDFTVADDGTVSCLGVKLADSLIRRIQAMADAHQDPSPLLRFYERLAKNPSHRSRTQLHNFLEHMNVAIEADGTFLAYKGVREDYMDCHSGTISNLPGSIVTMDRNLISDDADTPCHEGLHVGAQEYATDFGPVTVICRVDPEHVVCVPKDYNAQKMRCCKYEVVGEWSGETMAPMADSKDLPYEDNYENYEDEEGYQDDCDEEDCENCDGCNGVADMVGKALDAAFEALPAPVVTLTPFVLTALDTMNARQLMNESIDALRKYASNVLKIHGASRIPGGKSSLVSKIVNVRRRRARAK